MPIDLEHLIIYALVAAVLAFFARRLLCAVRGSGKCGTNCSCGKGEIRRDPVISNYLKRTAHEQPKKPDSGKENP
jgi:hypothetical protein